jgi:hypothetical protein
MPLRFDVDYRTRNVDWDSLVDEVFSELWSSFIEMPKGEGFIEYAVFEAGYQKLKQRTNAFCDVNVETVLRSVMEAPLAFVVFRCILGFTPPEWAYLTSETTNTTVEQGAARALDRRIRLNPHSPLPKPNSATSKRLRAMIEAGVKVLQAGARTVPPGIVHRLDKADTNHGLASMASIADLGVPYPMLLYERLLGRPYATHRDSVSELIGEVVEVAVRNVLTAAKVSYRETRRAERIPGFDQSPDFMIPDEFAPVALIEAKLTEDDGTARDKVARIQRLRALRDERGQSYDVIACIAGRGFKVRREDMRRLLEATDGKVFTLASMHQIVERTRIREYRIR